jgi:tetratricopeptide (TPR) repeat protein
MKYFLLIACLAIVYQTNAQIADTSIFTSKFEQIIFTQYLDSTNPDPVQLLLAFNYNPENAITIRTKIQEIIDELEKKNIGGKSIKKQVKLIYKYAHTSLLQKYDEQKSFYDVIETGEYNCVTASALYAILLDHFNIAYVIKETPRHVYLVADPNLNHIMIESTMPRGGVVTHDEKTQRNYVEFLVNNKLISLEEFQTNTIIDLFNKHYYQQENNINLQELTAIQYYNKGVFLFDEQRYEDAVSNLEKANIIYPSNSIKYMLSAALANLINDQSYKQNYSGKTLASYMNVNATNAETLSFVKEHLTYVANELAVNHPAIEKLLAYYKEFDTILADSIERDDFAQTYYYFLAYSDYVNQKYPSSFTNLQLAYLNNPENLTIKQLIHDTGLKHMFTDRQHESMIDSMEYYFEMFPFLLEYKDFQRYYTYCYLKAIGKNYSSDNENNGKEIINRFTKAMANHPDLILQEDQLEYAFMQVLVYYGEKDDIKNARKYTQLALEYVPESRILKEMVSEITDYKKEAQYVSVENTPKKKKEDFNKLFGKHFKGCWKAKSILKDGKMQALKENEYLWIVLKDGKKVEFRFSEGKQKGRWDLRPKGKLLYLIPKKDEKYYLVFKIIEISDEKLVLRPYVNKKVQNQILHFEHCR